MHPVAVEFDFMEPAGPVGRLIDQLRELRPDPLRQRRRGQPVRCASRHAGGIARLSGRRMRLFEMIDLADMLGGMSELEADACRQVGKRRPLITVTSCGMSARDHG